MNDFVGIDYGSKLAGTTVIAYFSNELIRFKSSKHQQDADKFILEVLEFKKPKYVFLDAPLSLPGKYVDAEKFDDYFYRLADRQLGAMSPMFLGGLTARAMKLRDQLQRIGITVFETYPSQEAQLHNLPKDEYKGNEKFIWPLAKMLAEQYAVNVNFDQMVNWHYFDALLAYIAGFRFSNNDHEVYGAEEEGLIVI